VSGAGAGQLRVGAEAEEEVKDHLIQHDGRQLEKSYTREFLGEVGEFCARSGGEVGKFLREVGRVILLVESIFGM